MTMGYWGAAFGFSTALLTDINSVFLIHKAHFN